MSGQLKRELGFWDLVLFHLTAIVGLRWISIAAGTGFSSIPLWITAFICFFLPQAYVLLKLSRKWPVEGGLYEWTKMGLGPVHGFISGWCYFFNNLFYYPTVLTTAAGYATYIYLSKWQGLEDNKWYIFWFGLIALWIVLFLNMVGLRIGKWVQNIGGLSTWIPGTIVIVLGTAYFVTHGSATPFHPEALLPKLNLDTWTFWSYICFAFAGFELITLMGGEIKNPEISIPRSIIAGGVIATVIYLLGTLALIVSLPSEKISLISGVLQAIGEQGRVFGIPFMVQSLAILLIFAQCGAVGAWLSGSGRVLYSCGMDRYLPSFFSDIHQKWSTPYKSILIQGVISSLFMVISAAGSTAREYWQQLLSATVIIYFIPYLYMFAAYFAFMQKKQMPRTFAGYASCVLGFFATAVSIIISMVPPPGKNPGLYVAKILGGTIVTIAIPIFLYYRAERSRIKTRNL
jgi:amino acid transporter